MKRGCGYGALDDGDDRRTGVGLSIRLGHANVFPRRRFALSVCLDARLRRLSRRHLRLLRTAARDTKRQEREADEPKHPGEDSPRADTLV